jgi:TrmH family RNA methyltransferase
VGFLLMLTSLQNPRVKLVYQLQHQRDVREREGLFVAEGARLADDFYRAGVRAAFAFINAAESSQAWKHAHPDVEYVEVSEAVMRKCSDETTPPGVLAVFHIPHPGSPNPGTPDDRLILVLDELREPGNLGACLRVAAGADARLVLLAPGCVDAYNPKVVRGGMGAHARQSIASCTWDEIAQVVAGRSVWTAEAGGSRRYDTVPWCEPNALIIGGEVEGISPDAHRIRTGSVMIPLANGVESLNAAVACGIILFEAARQRVQKLPE